MPITADETGKTKFHETERTLLKIKEVIKEKAEPVIIPIIPPIIVRKKDSNKN